MSRDGGAGLDLCVVGGGVAGTYVAHSALRARPGSSVGLFERSERVGGRLLSVAMPDVAGVRAELGGMRFRTSQPLVTGLVRSLGLDMRPFRTAHDDNRFFLRGARWRAGEPWRAASVYRLAADERDLSPGELLFAAFERVVPRAMELSGEQWPAVMRTHRWRGRPLREWTLGDLLADVLSADGHRYVLDGFGYATLLADRNAADAIPWLLIEARPEAENQTLVDGMERLPRELAQRFVAAGGRLHLDHELRAIEADRRGARLRLRFEGRPDVVADRVVLALPARALERIAQRSPLLDAPAVRTLLGSVTAHAAAKLFLAYERPWWRDGAGGALRVVTDLPLSKTFYFDRPAPDAGETAPLLLATYSDGPSRHHWRALGDDAQGADRAPYDSGERWRAYAASEAQVRDAQRQLAELHEREDLPDPLASAFVDWGRWDGAWHLWNAGVASQDVMARVAEPLPGVPLHLCGEAFSASQGWVEGALESAATVVRRLARSPVAP